MKKCIKCGSHAFNLYAEAIDQGGLCDVHYWQGRAHRAEAQLEQEPVALVLAERERIKAANAPEIERINTYIKKLEDCIRARGNT